MEKLEFQVSTHLIAVFPLVFLRVLQQFFSLATRASSPGRVHDLQSFLLSEKTQELN